MNEIDNLINLKRCPRWESCDIPLCPLDFFMKERVELPEDEKCILIARRGNRVKSNVRGKLKRIIGKYVFKQNRCPSITLPPSVWE